MFAFVVVVVVRGGCKGIFADGYTISDVVMYWRDEPVVGVEVRLESVLYEKKIKTKLSLF